MSMPIDQVIEILHESLPDNSYFTPDQNWFRVKLRDHARNNLGMLYTKLAMAGEVDVLESIYALCGKVPVDVQPINRYGRKLYAPNHTINGEEYDSYCPGPFLSGVSSPQDMGRLLELIAETGLGFLTGIGSKHSWLLDQTSALIRTTRLFRPGYDGELPIVDFESKRIDRPELLNALEERAKRSSYPEAFRQILCWVPRETVIKTRLHGWNTYISEQEISVTVNEGFPHGWAHESIEIKKLDDEKISKIFAGDEFRYKGFKLMSSVNSDEIDPVDNCLLMEMGSTLINYGFGYKEGYSLCRLDIAKLSHFQRSVADPEQVIKAENFVKDYTPIGVIASLYSKARQPHVLEKMAPIGIKGHVDIFDLNLAVKRLLSKIGDRDEVGQAILKNLPITLLRSLIQPDSSSFRKGEEPFLYLDSLIVANVQLGTDTSLLMGLIAIDELQACLDSKLIISATTYLEIPRLSIKKGKLSSVYKIQMHTTPSSLPKTLDWIFDSGGRIVNGHDLTDVKKSLRALSLNSNKKGSDWRMLHLCRVRAEGLENCVKLAKTEAQWKDLQAAFGTEAIMPFLDQSLRKYKGNLLSEGLGL